MFFIEENAFKYFYGYHISMDIWIFEYKLKRRNK